MPQPLKTWLIKSYLTLTKSGSCVLFVDPDNVAILNNTLYLSQIYSLIKKVNPDMFSLHISASNVAHHVKEKILEFENFEMEKK